jgi:hypothetical protein
MNNNFTFSTLLTLIATYGLTSTTAWLLPLQLGSLFLLSLKSWLEENLPLTPDYADNEEAQVSWVNALEDLVVLQAELGRSQVPWAQPLARILESEIELRLPLLVHVDPLTCLTRTAGALLFKEVQPSLERATAWFDAWQGGLLPGRWDLQLRNLLDSSDEWKERYRAWLTAQLVLTVATALDTSLDLEPVLLDVRCPLSGKRITATRHAWRVAGVEVAEVRFGRTTATFHVSLVGKVTARVVWTRLTAEAADFRFMQEAARLAHPWAEVLYHEDYVFAAAQFAAEGASRAMHFEATPPRARELWVLRRLVGHAAQVGDQGDGAYPRLAEEIGLFDEAMTAPRWQEALKRVAEDLEFEDSGRTLEGEKAPWMPF